MKNARIYGVFRDLAFPRASEELREVSQEFRRNVELRHTVDERERSELHILFADIHVCVYICAYVMYYILHGERIL